MVVYVSKATNLVRGDSNTSIDVFVWQSGTTRRLSVGTGGHQANADNFQPAISADGTVVAFESAATNLIQGDSNHRMDVYRRFTAGPSGGIERVSVGPGGQQGNGASFGPSLSASGDVVAFMSAASNLVPGDDNQARDVFVRSNDETELVSLATAGQQGDGDSVDPSISGAGTVVAFASECCC